MKRIFPLLAGLLVTLFPAEKLAAQQDVELVNSAKVISEGSYWFSIGKYNKAANLFKKISRNDTNYALATLDLCISYSQDKEDSLCYITAMKGLELESPYRSDFYSMGVVALREMKKYDEALKLIDQGLAEYPNVYGLHYNKGIVYYEQKRYWDAYPCFQESVKLNPFHSMSHWYLGKCAYAQGRTIPAILSFEMYLIMTNSDGRADQVVVQIEDMYKNNPDFDPETMIDRDSMGDECFDDLLEVIQSGIALRPAYKNTTGIDLAFVKVRQAMFEKMSFKEKTGNWWMEFYIPFYMELFNKGHFVAFNYYSLSSISNEQVQKGWKKNKKKIRAFAQWLNDYLSDNSKHPEKVALADQTNSTAYFYDNRMLFGVGHINPTTKKTVGEWKYFYSSSGLLLGKGSYNDKTSQMEGEWIYYHPNGKVKEKTNYKAGKEDGLSELWWDNGEKRSVYHYAAGKLIGDFEEYSYHGGIYMKGSYLNGKINGPVIMYYPSGQEQYNTAYLNGKLSGDFKSYYRDGKIWEEFTVLNDKKNGAYKEYYNSGEVYSEGAYKNDLESGTWKTFYRDGTLASEGIFKTPGKKEGIWKEYYPGGKLAEETMWKAGKLNGAYKMYTEEGQVTAEYTYKTGKLTNTLFRDAKGKELGSFVIGKGRVEVREYYPDGTLAAEGDYLNQMRDGQWTIYDENGGWKYAHVNYEKDIMSGRLKYYHPNGKVQFETDYVDGYEHGYRKTFHLNGEIESEGWIQYEMKQGDWFEYNVRGIIAEHTYYLNDYQYGTQEFFDSRGKTREEVRLKRGVGVERRMYDSTGTVVYSFKAENGTGEFAPLYVNGKKWVSANYFRGARNETYQRIGWDGRVLWNAQYKSGYINGLSTVYYDFDDQKYNEATYMNGSMHGPYTGWWENGKLFWEENYVGGDKHGVQKYYHTNGELQRTSNYVYGTINGEMKFYSSDGMLQCVRYYKNGVLLGYSYEGQDGNLVPMIRLPDASGKVECMYRNGKKSIEGEIVNGELDGNWVEYYSNGDVKEDENFAYGQRHGVQTRYYPDKKVQEVETYYYDELDGPCKYYYENGKLKRTETYVLGEKSGRWYFYNDQEQLTTTRLFYGGLQQDEVVVPVAPPVPDPKTKKPKGK